MEKLPDTCVSCRWREDRSKYHGNHLMDKCMKNGVDEGYVDIMHQYRFKDKPCSHSEKLIKIKDSRLWIQLYKKGLEKEEIPVADKEKALVRANWLVMKIAYIADSFIRKYDERMDRSKLRNIVKQAVNQFIQQ